MFENWFPQDMTTLRKLLWFRTAWEKSGRPPVPTDPLNTFVGSIVRFFSHRALPIVKLEANFTPIQNLNGQEAPWPPGGSKQLLDTTKFVQRSGYSNLTASINGNVITFSGYTAGGRFGCFNVPTVVGESYTIKYTACTNMTSSNIGYLESDTEPTAWLGSGTGIAPNNALTYTATKPWLQIYGDMSADNATITNLMVEKGSTASTWQPYSNICPISGHTGCEVVRTGKNLLDPDEREDLTNNIHFCFDNGLLLKANQAYTFSVSQAAAQLTISKYDGTGNLAIKYSNTAVTYTPTEDILARFDVYYSSSYPAPSGGTSAVNCQLELGSTASDYEPYSGTTVSLSFGQTVYGGKLTVFEDGSGQIVANKAYALLNDQSLWYVPQSTSANFAYDVEFSDAKNTGDSYSGMICSYVPVVYGAEPYGRWLGATNHKFGIKWASGTLADIKQAASDGKIAICYELATPITIPLTASQINTLVGENVVFVNGSSGDITVLAYGTEIS